MSIYDVLQYEPPFKRETAKDSLFMQKVYPQLYGSKSSGTKSQVSALMAQEGMRVPGEAPPQEAANGPASGVIGGENASPAETVADDIPMDVPEGSFIINAAAAEVAGYGDIKTMIMDAIGVARRLGVEISTGDEQVGDEEAVDLLVSKGEVYIEPTLAKIIGYDVLEKINNRGKREVARRQQEAEAQQQQEQPQQQAPQAPQEVVQEAPQMAQTGGFVKKKFADGDKVITRLDDPDRIPDEYDLMGEVSPVPDEQIAMGDIEYQMETMRRSGDDPVVMKAFADDLGRTLSNFARARDTSVGELVKQDHGRFIQNLETDALINDPKTFNDEDVQKDIEEKFKDYLSKLEDTDSYVGDYYTDDAIKKAQEEGRNFLPKAGQRYQGVYIPSRFQTNLLTGEKETLGDRIFYPTGRGSAENLVMSQYILYHELIHKSHEELIGNHVQPRNKNKLAEGINFNSLLHLDVHKRTYYAYKNDLSKNQLIDFIDGAQFMYSYKDDYQSTFKNLLANLTDSPNTLEWWQYSSKIRKYSPEKVRSIADTVFDTVDNLPEIKELNKTLNTAAANKQADRFSKLRNDNKQQDSRGFAERANGSPKGGETKQEFPDYIKKYFMPEIDYHLETIRSKTVARNQYGQPTTAYTSGVRRGDKIYEIPTYDRKGGILSRAEVEASLDSYIKKYGDFGIPQGEYNTLMRDKEAYKQELYSKDNRFKVPEDAITQKIVLPEEEQQNSGGFIPKK